MECLHDAVIASAVLEGLGDILFEVLFLVVGSVGRHNQRAIRCGDLDQFLQQLRIIFRYRKCALFCAGKAWRIDDGHVILQFLSDRVADEIEDIHYIDFLLLAIQVIDGELFLCPFQRTVRNIDTRRFDRPAHGCCHGERAGVAERVQDPFACRITLRQSAAYLALIQKNARHQSIVQIRRIVDAVLLHD